MRAYHGVSMITSNNWSSPGEVFNTDACLTGCGGICARYYFHAEFPEFISIQRLDIIYLELLTIVVALKLWGHLWRGFRLTVRRDNELGPSTHSLRALVVLLLQLMLVFHTGNFRDMDVGNQCPPKMAMSTTV